MLMHFKTHLLAVLAAVALLGAAIVSVPSGALKVGDGQFFKPC